MPHTHVHKHTHTYTHTGASHTEIHPTSDTHIKHTTAIQTRLQHRHTERHTYNTEKYTHTTHACSAQTHWHPLPPSLEGQSFLPFPLPQGPPPPLPHRARSSSGVAKPESKVPLCLSALSSPNHILCVHTEEILRAHSKRGRSSQQCLLSNRCWSPGVGPLSCCPHTLPPSEPGSPFLKFSAQPHPLTEPDTDTSSQMDQE